MSATPSADDVAAVKSRQQATWASGDYSVIGTTLQVVGENLCEASTPRPDGRSSMLRLATAARRVLPRAVAAKSPRPTTSDRCSTVSTAR